MLVKDNCVGCGHCLPHCPRGAISVMVRCTMTQECNDCGICARWCPVGALEGEASDRS